jgi:hypothetical protein
MMPGLARMTHEQHSHRRWGSTAAVAVERGERDVGAFGRGRVRERRGKKWNWEVTAQW